MVERTHRETLKLLRGIVNDERVKERWSAPHIIGIVQFILNSEMNEETSVSPFQSVFGSVDAKYFKLPDESSTKIRAKELLKKLDDDLFVVRKVAEETMERMRAKRVQSDPDAGVASYSVKDLVLLKNERPVSKLQPVYLGPYKILKIYKADVTVQHLVTGAIKVVQMANIKPYFGDEQEAFRAALADYDQFEIETITAYRGDPEVRSETTFLVYFKDGDKMWVPYSKDLASSIPFENYCRSVPQLLPLVFTVEIYGSRWWQR